MATILVVGMGVRTQTVRSSVPSRRLAKAVVIVAAAAACGGTAGVASGQTAALACENWNTQFFFEAAMADDVTRCLRQGAGLRVVGEFGATALHWAAWVASAEVVQVLLAQGASADLHLEMDSGWRPLHLAAMSGSADVFRAIWDAGGRADVHAQTDTRVTPLHSAAMSGNAEIVQILLGAGALSDLHAEAQAGWRPLHYAARYGNAEMVEVLLSAGATRDVRATTSEDNHPLHYAAIRGDVDMVDLLLSAGADLNAEGDWGRTPLSFAFAAGSNEVASTLLDLGAVPQGREGESICGETPDMQLMVVYGPDPDGVWAAVGQGSGGSWISFFVGDESTEAEAMDGAGLAELVAQKIGLDTDSSDPSSFWPLVKPWLTTCDAVYYDDLYETAFPVRVYVMPYTMLESAQFGLPGLDPRRFMH